MRTIYLKITVCSLLFLCLFGSTVAREILSYTHGSSTRKEEGDPGSKVTGEWSWMNKDGEMQTIRYIADKMGFRAFGDVIPDNDWARKSKEIPEIGSSVVPAMSTTKDIVKASESQHLRQTDEKGQTKFPSYSNRLRPNINLDHRPKSSNLPDAGKSDADKEVTNEKEEPKNTETSVPVAEDTETNTDDTGQPANEDKTEPPQPPSKIPGTSFVLLSHMRLPSKESSAVPRPNEIRPRPVIVTGELPSPVTGILSAPRAIKVLDNKRAKNLGPDLNSEKRVPRPSKVEGMINFDNYLRPAHTASNPNSHVNRNNFDYYYYDYYYDDKPNEQSQSKKSKARTVRSEESKESFEDFEYEDDISNEQRRKA